MLEAKTPSSDYIDIPESEPLRLDCDKLLGTGAHRLQDLWHAQRRQVERGPHLRTL